MDINLTQPIHQVADQPLAALGLPKNKEQALHAMRFPMDFNCCANCGHIFNVDFDISKIPYETDTNLMYNNGTGWQEYLSDLAGDLIASYDLERKTVVDIGCGDGGFLSLLRNGRPNLRCIGYEPGTEATNGYHRELEIVRDYFEAERDLQRIKPDMLVCRHVLEHMENPKSFVENIAYWCNLYERFPIIVAEVPRFDKAIQSARINDYLYEHVSNFTHYSFVNMFESAGYEILDEKAVYGDEIVVVVARVKNIERIRKIVDSSASYVEGVKKQNNHIGKTLQSLRSCGKSIAFWGGTGKGASFLNSFSISADSYPVVIDSDYQKVGRFVPGTGQEICSPDKLKENPSNVIVITTQWRANDIYNEIIDRDIKHDCAMVLIDQELRKYDGEDQGKKSVEIIAPHLSDAA